MKYLPVYIITTVSLLLTACSADPIAETPIKYEINFGTGVVATRGVIESDENDIPLQDMTDIQVIRGTDGNTPQGFNTAPIASAASITAGSGVMNMSTTQYFNDFENDAHFMAFYPKHDNYVAGKASWTIDGTQDIMKTTPVTAPFTRGGTTVAFEFNHCLAQVIFKLVAANQPSADLFGNLSYATIKVPSKLEMIISDNGNAALDKTDNTTKTVIDFGAMTLKTDTVTSKGVMIYPDATDLTHISLKFERSKAVDYPIEGLVLTPGYKTVIVARVNGNAVNFNVSLQPWKKATETPGKDDAIGLGKPGESLK